MKIEKMNHWLTLMANVGVIVGIIFLGVEIQQNTSMMKAQTRNSMTELLVNWQMNVSSNQFAAVAFAKGYNDEFLDLENGEESAFRMLALSTLRMWENEYYQYQEGLFSQAEYEPKTTVMWERNMRASKGLRRIWSEHRDGFSPEFRMVFDDFVAGLEANSTGN